MAKSAPQPDSDPTVELGSSNASILPWSSYYDSTEEAPELAWPHNVKVYDRMRHDEQIAALDLSFVLPILGYRWHIEPNGARDEVVERVARNYGLPIKGESADDKPMGRMRDRFDFHEYLRHALLKRMYGFMFFEQVYRLADDGFFDVRKYAPRLPGSIQQVETDEHGGLAFIRQWAAARPGAFMSSLVQGAHVDVLGPAFQAPVIPVDRLIAHVNDKEGGNWYGHALPLDTPIPTPDGWTTMGEIKVDGRLFDETGKVRHVVAKSPVWEARPCYKVTFNDGGSLIADENHLWESWTYRARHCDDKPSILSTKEMAESLYYGNKMAKKPLNHAVAPAEPLQYQEQAQLIHPYVLGAWLGDGTSVEPEITSASWDVEHLAAEVEACGYATKIRHNGLEGGNGRLLRIYGLASQLRALGLIGEKHIPDGYLRASYEQRLALLQGLMDTDGSVNNGACEFSNTNRELADAALELARSLGCRAGIYEKAPRKKDAILPSGKPVKTQYKQAWRVCFSPRDFVPFRLPRKIAKWEQGDARQRGATKRPLVGPRKWRIIRSIELVEPRDTVCIEVDSPSHLFVAGEHMVVTHNSWLRDVYRNWAIKDRLLRVDSIKNERNGMGVPTGKTEQGVTQKALDKLMAIVKAWKVGDQAAAALPPGTDIELKGVTGTLPDTLGSVRYHDEQMARRFVQMFSMLGSTQTGSRALGETFVDFFGLAQEAVAKEVADVTTAHGIEDLIDVNYSIDENAPRLWFRPESDRALPTTDLVALINAGAIKVDPELEAYIRAEHDLPDAAPSNEQPDPPSDQQPSDQAPADLKLVASRRHSPIRLAATNGRKPSEIEQQSKVDFEALRGAFNSTLTDLVNNWSDQVKQPQITELIALVAASDPTDLNALASIQATPQGADLLALSAHDLIDTAAAMALKEVNSQGGAFELPDLADVKQLLTDKANAVEIVMANWLSQSAATEALANAGEGASAHDVATAVGDHLNSLTDAYPKRQLGGTLMEAQNSARGNVFNSMGDDVDLYSSELVDYPNCCDPCIGIDGTEYANYEAAKVDYVTGGYKDCEGGLSCRGCIVAVLKSETAPTLQ